jgi:hypothetical protein
MENKLSKFGSGYLALAFVIIAAFPSSADAGKLKVTSKHKKIGLEHKNRQIEYYVLQADEMLTLTTYGPDNIGLRLRELKRKNEAIMPIDLTVVRDDIEQGTVRIRLPSQKEVGVAELGSDLRASDEVFVKIEVPKGRHQYRILATGHRKGVLIHVFLGVRHVKNAIVATPGKIDKKSKVVEAKKVKPKIVKKPSKVKLEPPSDDVLAVVPSYKRADRLDEVSGYAIHHRPGEERYGPVTKLTGSTALVFFTATLPLVISGVVFDSRSKNEPVQVVAGQLRDRAKSTYQAAAIMGGVTVALIGATIIAYFVEKDSQYPNKFDGSLLSIEF